MKKKILFDLESLQSTTNNDYDGGAEYTKVVLDRILKDKFDNVEILFNYHPDRTSKYFKLEDIEGKGFQVIQTRDKRELENVISDNKIDTFFSTIPYEYYDVNFECKKFLIVIHGLRPIELPTDKYEYKYALSYSEFLKAKIKWIFRTYYKSILRKKFQNLIESKNCKIVAVSNHTKYSLISHFPVLSPDQIEVLYSPGKKNEHKLDSNQSELKQDVKGDYFVLVSSKRWTKNAIRMIESFQYIYDHFPNFNYKVLILGSASSSFLKKHYRDPRFIFKGYVSTEELNSYYRNSYALLFPSLNEGFGYPPLEAMCYGKPVLASSVTSITEVCGDAPLYFNPYDKMEMINRVLQLTNEPEIYEKCVSSSKEVYSLIKDKQTKDLNRLISLIVQ